MPLSELTVDLSKMCGPSRLGPPLDTPSTPPLDALDARTELGPRHPSMLPLMQPLDAPRCRPSSPSMSMVVEVTLDALDVDPRRPLDDPSMHPRYSTPQAQQWTLNFREAPQKSTIPFGTTSPDRLYDHADTPPYKAPAVLCRRPLGGCYSAHDGANGGCRSSRRALQTKALLMDID